MTAANAMTAALEYFERTGRNPGDWWAFTDDQSEMCLEFNGNDGAKFWLDLNKDGTIQLMWRAPDTTKAESINFVPR